ncbi:MAG: hypothetical protein U0234_06915 [Sandaracinus sp.]
MKPWMRTDRVVAAIALVSCALSIVAVVAANAAEAQRGRRGSRGSRSGRSASTAPAEAPESAAIAPALDEIGIHWGMNPHDTFEHFSGQITEAFRPRIAKATGAIEEDRLRAERDEGIRRIRASFIRFRGQASGWDTSFLRDEFTSGNNESMMVVREDATHSTSHYFFINDHLWKRYQAYDASAFGAGVTFDQFAEAIQRRFGPGVERSGSLVEGRPPTRWVEWQDATTRLRAVDQTRFYGFFCLVFEERATLAQLPQLRTHTITHEDGGHALVDSILRDESEAGTADDAQADIADRLSGHTRHRTDAPETPSGSGSSPSTPSGSGSGSSSGSTGSTGSSSSGSTGSSSGSTGSGTRRTDPDDPFAGMSL